MDAITALLKNKPGNLSELDRKPQAKVKLKKLKRLKNQKPVRKLKPKGEGEKAAPLPRNFFPHFFSVRTAV